eukprot:m.113912 g.113912  ORF g.113912 m.113912 type:complete len:259 (+) comp37469_c0_seq2:478-1254(+)
MCSIRQWVGAMLLRSTGWSLRDSAAQLSKSSASEISESDCHIIRHVDARADDCTNDGADDTLESRSNLVANRPYLGDLIAKNVLKARHVQEIASLNREDLKNFDLVLARISALDNDQGTLDAIIEASDVGFPRQYKHLSLKQRMYQEAHPEVEMECLAVNFFKLVMKILLRIRKGDNERPQYYNAALHVVYYSQHGRLATREFADKVEELKYANFRISGKYEENPLLRMFKSSTTKYVGMKRNIKLLKPRTLKRFKNE